MKEFFKEVRELAKAFRVMEGDDFRLKDIDSGDTLDLKSSERPISCRRRLPVNDGKRSTESGNSFLRRKP